MATFRLKRLTLPTPNELTDPSGRAYIELEDTAGGPGLNLSMPYPSSTVPTPIEICEWIRDNVGEDNGYDDDTCGI